MIVIGRSAVGGTLTKQADLLDRAVRDLSSKLGKSDEIIALTVYRDEAALYVVAAVKGGEKKEEDSHKKGGK